MSEMIENEELNVSEEEAGFYVDDDQKAEWCLDKIREANAEKEKWTAFYMDRLKKICDREDSRIAFFEMKLAMYFGMVPHKETKTQASYQLPSGKLVLKEQKPEWTHDDAQLLPWVKENLPGFVRTKETVDWAELKKELGVIVLDDGSHEIVNADGLIVPGVTVTERPEKFVVEVK